MAARGSNVKTAIVTMEVEKNCKNVIRYASDDDDAAMSTAYVSKAALAKLGDPDKIKITISPA